jgi:hypothetical protein
MTLRAFTAADNGSSVTANVGDSIAVTLAGIGWTFSGTGTALGPPTTTNASDLSTTTGTFPVVAAGGGIASAVSQGGVTFALTVSTPGAGAIVVAPPVVGGSASAAVSAASLRYAAAARALAAKVAVWQGQVAGITGNTSLPSNLTLASWQADPPDASTMLVALGNLLGGLSEIEAAGNNLALAATTLLQLQPPATVVAPAPPGGGISTGAAVGVGVGGLTAGAIAGGLIGHAIGSGLILAAEARDTRKGKRRRRWPGS